MGTGKFNAGGNPAMDWHPIQGGVEIFLVASCHGNQDKLRPDGPLGSYADFTYPTLHIAVLTRKMFHVANDDQIACNKSNLSKKLGENSDEKRVITLLHQVNVFNVNKQITIPERLQNMVTKVVATTQIEESWSGGAD